MQKQKAKTKENTSIANFIIDTDNHNSAIWLDKNKF